MKISDFNKLRRDYDEMAIGEHIEFHERFFEDHPGQSHFDRNFIPAIIPTLGDISVVEIGGWDGELAEITLRKSDNVVRWANYELCPQVVDKPVATDERYIVTLTKDKWVWDMVCPADVLVMSHVIEHMKLDQFEKIVCQVRPSDILVTAPLRDYNRTWDNFLGAHVMTASWPEVDAAMSSLGYDVELSEGWNRHYKRRKSMVKMIFVHIPKTGGQSLRKFFLDAGLTISNPYSLLGTRPELDDRMWTDLEALKREMRSKTIPEVDILQDYMHVDLFDGMYPGVPRVTLLRNPVDRVVSAYHYWQRKNGLPENVSLRDFAKRTRHANAQHFLTGGDLSKFDVVGTTERFSEFATEISALLGIQAPTKTYTENVGTYEPPSASDKRSVAYRNRLDTKLWKSVQA